MNLSSQLSKHFHDVHFGGNWTVSNLKDNLAGISWEEATTQVHGLNTIAVLVYHVNYYVDAVLKVLQGEVLSASDKFSFACPPIHSQQDWEKLVNKALEQAEQFTQLIGQLPEEKWAEDFSDKKYGSWYRNISGIIEHTHYHLGQIALIKKIIREGK